MHSFGIDTRDPQEYLAALDKLRLMKLKRQIAYVFSNEDYYRPIFLEAGVSSPEDVRSFDDFRRLPIFLDKNRHRQSQDASLERYGHPFGLHLIAPVNEVIHVAATSGTTGQPTFYVFTRKDLELAYRLMARLFAVAGVMPGDTTFHAFGLSMWLAGITYFQGLQAYGALPIGVGAEGGIPKILRYMEYTRPKALFATPSLLGQLIERAPDEIGKPVGSLGVRILFCVGEPGVGIAAIRTRLREAFGAEIHDAMAGAWNNATVSCDGPGYHGMHHLSEDYYFRYDPRRPASAPAIVGADDTNRQSVRLISSIGAVSSCEIHKRLNTLGLFRKKPASNHISTLPSATKDGDGQRRRDLWRFV